MDSVLARLGRLVVNDDGQDLLEYGLLAVLIAVVVLAGLTTVGQTIYAVFWQAIAHVV
jgi:Flp pilus assembly pilin Flp